MSTYSFQEVTATFSHRSGRRLTTNGQGIGSITAKNTADRSSLDVASDGTVVTNKIKDRSGSIDISCQQTSDLNRSFIQLFNYIEGASASEHATITATITSRSTGEQRIGTGCSILKIPDGAYDKTVQMITWTLLVSDLQNNVL